MRSLCAILALCACTTPAQLAGPNRRPVAPDTGTAVPSGTPGGSPSGTPAGTTTTGGTVTLETDADGDGYPDPADCDDADAAIHPDAQETGWNGVDEDCDGVDGRLPQVAAGDAHTCVLDLAGELQCWGDNSFGQSPIAPGPYAELAAGSSHTCALDAAGTPTCWGDDGAGQSAPPPGLALTRIAAGYRHTCGLDAAGSLHCWGDLEGHTPPAGTWIDVSAGWRRSCARDAAGTVECWGHEPPGSLAPPVALSGPLGKGARHLCGVDAIGALCWGQDDYFGRASDVPGTFLDVAAGEAHTCALDDSGMPACWGSSVYGADDPPAIAPAVQIAAGAHHTCVVDALGTSTCWGLDAQGQL